MKYFNVLTFLILCLGLSITACNNDSDKVREQARESLKPVTPTDTPAPPTANPSNALNSEPHYKCPNNCAGGVGAAQGNCPVCGTALAHNQAYHSQDNNTLNQANNPITDPNIQVQPPAPQQPSPAQNAAGVYHYTCGNGCAGGSGAAGTCSSCGGALAHNPAYHNN